MQELDARADQLRHQRAKLPELAEIAELTAKRTDVDNLARDARITVDDLTVEQKKVDLDVEAVKTRRTRDRDRMDQGLITNPKDLERMQHELESLERRISSLEDDELEVMEKIEEAQKELAELRADGRRDRRAARARSRGTRDEKIAAIDEQLATVQADRGPAAEGLPEDLVKLYLRLRESKGGVGAALLRARTCSGCQLSLDSVELSRIKGLPGGRGGPLRGVRPDPGAHLRVGAVTAKVIIEADGGSRGNPGPAAYGAVLTDAETGEVIAEDGSTIGVASNNVAEYSGLIAGLRARCGVRSRAPTSRCGWTPSSSSSRCRATGRSSTRR